MKKIIFLSILISLLSCKTEKKEKEFIDSEIESLDIIPIDIESIPVDTIEDKPRFKKEKLLDTIIADNYNVLFFKPIESEYDMLLEKYGENSGLEEVDSDYSYYANKVYQSLLKTDLKLKIVSERIIKLNTQYGVIYLDRINNDKGEYGIILNQTDCEPRIEFGVMTDVDIFQFIEDYKNNCK